MPAYNAGLYIQDAIRSVQRQSYTNWELIIVNDGSTDDTAEKVEELGDSRIYSYYQPNKGQCAAANEAFRRSKGALIKFMDADDLVSENYFRSQVDSLRGKPGAISFASWGRFYNDDLNTFRLNDDWASRDERPLNWLIQSMSGKQVMLQCALWLIPREILERSGLWDERLSLINDFEFFIRVLLQAEELVYAKDAVLYYRSGVQGSLSGTGSAKAVLSAYNSIDWGTQHLLDTENTERTRRIAADCFQHLVYSLYPKHAVLVRKAEQRIKSLGGSGVPFPAGGYTRLLSCLLGWKATKRIKLLI